MSKMSSDIDRVCHECFVRSQGMAPFTKESCGHSKRLPAKVGVAAPKDTYHSAALSQLKKLIGTDADSDEMSASAVSKLRKFIIQVLDEQQKQSTTIGVDTLETAANGGGGIKQTERKLEAGVFKIVVHSAEQSPLVPTRFVGSSSSSGSGFLVNISDFPAFDGERADEAEVAAGLVELAKEQEADSTVLPATWFVVTNAHVVDGAQRVQALSALYPTVPIEMSVELVSFDLDLALLRVQALPSTISRTKARSVFVPFKVCTLLHKFVQLNGEEGPDGVGEAPLRCNFKRLQKVYAVGYPLGVDRVQITEGTISGFERVSQEPVIQITAPINHGNSGGPLIDEDGRVLAITSAGIPSAENVGFSIPIQYVFNLLVPLIVRNSAKGGGRVAHLPYLGAQLVPVEKFVDIVPDFDPLTQTLYLNANAEAIDHSVAPDSIGSEGESLGGTFRAVGKLPGDNGSSEQRVTGAVIMGFEPISILKRPLQSSVRGSQGEFRATGAVIEPQVYDTVTQINEFRIGNDGLTLDATYPRKVSFEDLYRTLPFGVLFRVRFFRIVEDGTPYVYENVYAYEPRPTLAGDARFAVESAAQQQEYAIRPFVTEEQQQFHVLPLRQSLVLAPLTFNLIGAASRALPHLMHYALNQNRVHHKLVVLHDSSGALRLGDIVKKIDGRLLFVDEPGAIARNIHPAADPVVSMIRELVRRIGSIVQLETEDGNRTFVRLDPTLFMFLGFNMQ